MLGNAFALAAALRRREAEAPFDLVQSADYLGAGLFVPRRPGRPHLVRCSSASELTGAADGDESPRRRWMGRLQRACIRRADAAYAPSRFVAQHFAERHGLRVHVVRPPLFREAEPSDAPIPDLPKRYLIHFGKLSGVKGTPVLARALTRAWKQEPELTVVLAGRDRDQRLPEWRALWGPQRTRVVWLGELEKPELYAALRGAEAAVLPSLADNLPNTAIESLMFGVPVIASAGASLDELVESGSSGELVPAGDEAALADAMLRAWRGQGVRRGFRWNSEIADAMRPQRAVEGLLRLGGLSPPERP
jgi:glycosyltransferase involved in cell wall biosynthesis